MTGTVRVVDQPSLASTITNSSKIDTVGAYMVPARTVDQYVSEFKSHGLGIDRMQQFKALRNGSGNILLVWTSAGMDLNKVLTETNNSYASIQLNRENKAYYFLVPYPITHFRLALILG